MSGPDISLLELFCIFFYIGLFTIGGGLVAITLMQQEIVNRGLISSDLFYNMVAISESTPGPIGINMATYIGYKLYGIPGGIITTFGQVLPSLICIVIIAKFLSKFAERKGVQSVFGVIRPASTGLIFIAVLNIFVPSLLNVPESFSVLKTFEGWKNLFQIPSVIFFCLLLIVQKKLKVHPVLLILSGAVFGLFVF